jgi:uncharacterized protein with beta-barrel porin domain
MKEEVMKRRSWLGFLMGVVFCLLMVLPSFVHADVTIDNWTGSSYYYGQVDLETLNSGSSSRNATVTGDNSDNTLWASVSGWNINVTGGEVNTSSEDDYGVVFSLYGNDSNLVSGTLTNSGYIYGYENTVSMASGTVTNYGTIYSDSDNGVYIYGYGGYETGTATVNNYGTISSDCERAVDISNVGTVTVNNYAGGLLQSTEEEAVHIYSVAGDVTVTNSGTIAGVHDAVKINDVNGNVTVTNSDTIESNNNDGIYINNVMGNVTVTNSDTITGNDYGIYINNVGPVDYVAGQGVVTVTNNLGGVIHSYNDEAISINDVWTANVNNYGTIIAENDDGISIDHVGTVNVTNSGIINSYGEGMDIWNVDDVTVTNTASGVIQASDDDGIDIYGVYRATVNNHGSIYSNDDGIYIGYTDTVTVNNTGKIQSEGSGIVIDNINETTESLGVTDGDLYVPSYITKVNNSGVIDAGNKGVFIKTNNDEDQVNVTNSGTITASNEGVRIYLDGNNQTAEVINTSTGTITSTDWRGVDLDIGSSSNNATITNSGIIKSTGTDSDDYGIKLVGGGYDGVDYVSKTVINNAGGLISGTTGIWSKNGYTTIVNYGTIETTRLFFGIPVGNAIDLRGDYNQVTLGTGSVINGLIIADGNYENNNITLEALNAADVNTMDAYKMSGFSSMNKTGAGTWILTGDAYYPLSTDYNHDITVEEGVLAFAERDKFGFGFDGVKTDYFTQNPGASLGIVVIPSDKVYAPYTSTGALMVDHNADFNNGTIVILPAAGKYLATTIYEHVLSVDYFSDNDENSLDPRWSKVTASAFLSASLVEDMTTVKNAFAQEIDGYSGGVYDLYLTKLSFTTGATESNMGLAGFLDDMYDTADGDLREIMNELMAVPAGAGGRALSELSGGTHTALQLMSLNGLGKYLGVLNNHLGGGGGFAGNNPRTGMAWYENGDLQGAQLAMAGGGNSMSDAAPLLLAALGNFGTGQIASGTKWGLWLDGYYSMGNRSSSGEAISRYKQTLYGGMIGFDYRATDNLLFGVSAGLSDTDLKFDELMDNGNMKSTHGSVYACYDGKPWYVAGVLTYAYNNYNMDRFITNLGPTQIASSDYAGKEFMGYAEVGYKLNFGPVVIRPLAAFQVDYLTQDSFAEHGAGIYDLYVDNNNSRSNQSFLGVNVSGAVKLGSSVSLAPELRLKWAHEFSSDEHLINARFSGMGSGSWVSKTEALSADTAIIGLGLNFMFKKNISAYIQYDAELNRDFVNHTGLLGLRFSW